MKKTDKKDGINVDIRSKESAYITIKTLAGKWTIYVDNSTGEHIIESWVEWSANINKEKENYES